MRTFTCTDCWKVFSVRENGWHQGSGKPVASLAAMLRKRLRVRTEGWEEGRRRGSRGKKEVAADLRRYTLIRNLAANARAFTRLFLRARLPSPVAPGPCGA